MGGFVECGSDGTLTFSFSLPMGNTSSRSLDLLEAEEVSNVPWRNQEHYEGDVDEENLYHGRGVLHYASDDARQRERYDGEWLHGKRHGKGTLNWSNGAVYQGTWKNDMLHGMGIFHLPSGLCYEGEFSENKFQGLGVLLWKNGKKYEGSWLANRHHGFGCLTYPPDDHRNRVYYKGEWKSGKRHGYGTMLWNNGAKYAGQWVRGKRQGLGRHVFPSQQIYIGNWENGRREGKGCRYFCNGDRYEGEWKRDKKHGHGYYIFAHGRRVPHYHENGKPNESMCVAEIPSLLVLCVEKIAECEDLSEKAEEVLTPELNGMIQKYRENELHLHQVPSSSIIQHLHAVISRFSHATPRDRVLS